MYMHECVSFYSCTITYIIHCTLYIHVHVHCVHILKCTALSAHDRTYQKQTEGDPETNCTQMATDPELDQTQSLERRLGAGPGWRSGGEERGMVWWE